MLTGGKYELGGAEPRAAGDMNCVLPNCAVAGTLIGALSHRTGGIGVGVGIIMGCIAVIDGIAGTGVVMIGGATNPPAVTGGMGGGSVLAADLAAARASATDVTAAGGAGVT
jgi:hypothetical protein